MTTAMMGSHTQGAWLANESNATMQPSPPKSTRDCPALRQSRVKVSSFSWLDRLMAHTAPKTSRAETAIKNISVIGLSFRSVPARHQPSRLRLVRILDMRGYRAELNPPLYQGQIEALLKWKFSSSQ